MVSVQFDVQELNISLPLIVVHAIAQQAFTTHHPPRICLENSTQLALHALYQTQRPSSILSTTLRKAEYAVRKSVVLEQRVFQQL